MSEFRASSQLVYRPFTAADVAAGHRLSSLVRWPHKPDDWRLLVRLGQGFVALDADEVVGTALYWQYGEAGGSPGMVIVLPDQQGRGIGRTPLVARWLPNLPRTHRSPHLRWRILHKRPDCPRACST